MKPTAIRFELHNGSSRRYAVESASPVVQAYDANGAGSFTLSIYERTIGRGWVAVIVDQHNRSFVAPGRTPEGAVRSAWKTRRPDPPMGLIRAAQEIPDL